MFIKGEWYVKKILLWHKALGIKLKVTQLKHKHLKIIRTIIKITEYDVKISHAVFRVPVLCE
jgi:hypothetical protein